MSPRIRRVQPLTTREQPLLQVPDQLSSTNEARQITLTHQHHLHQDDDLLGVRLQCHKSTRHARPEVPELVRVLSTQHVQHLLCELKWRRLKLHALARSIAQQKSKINMQNVSFNINHNVTVVSVLNLQDVAHQGIGSQTVAEIIFRNFESGSFRPTKLPVEEIQQSKTVHLLLDRANS